MTKIVTIWGGAGTFNVLYGLKQNTDLKLSAIISMCDNGGTTWSIRDKFGILPPGDIRRAIAALAKNTGMVRKLFEYKFDEEGVIWGNKIGNILLTALHDITGSFEWAVESLSEMFDVQWTILPVTLEDVHLGVRFSDGIEVIGEKNIDISDKNPWERTHDPDSTIIDAFLVGWKGVINPKAKQVILEADYVIMWPWDLYTSVVPNLLSEGMRETLAESKAKMVYMCNIMTKRGETGNMEVIDFIDVIEKYAWPDLIDYVVVNNGYISDETVEKYKTQESKRPVKVKDPRQFDGKRYKIIEADLIDEADIVRHSPQKVSEVLEKIMSQNI
jgi:uncharacterized cofD-like protein